MTQHRMDSNDNKTWENGTEYDYMYPVPLPFISRFFLVFTSLTIIISNVLVLAVLMRMKSCLTKMQLFLQSLAVADLLVGLMWLLLHFEDIVGMDLYEMTNWLCLLVIHLPAIALMVSVLTLSLISLERYIAVVRPFQYHKWITRQRAKYAVAAVWILSTLLFVPVYIPLLLATSENPTQHCEKNFKNVLYTCLYIMTIIIIPNVFLSLYCYTCIVRNIFQRDRILKRHQSSMRCGRRFTERTLAKVSISVYSGFYITWMPFVVVSFIAYVDLLAISDVLYYSTLNFGLWNSLLNCLIYSISHKPFRRELKLLVLSTLHCCCCYCCCCCQGNGTSQETTSQQCCQVAAVYQSPRQSRRPVWSISKDVRDSMNNLNRQIAKEIHVNGDLDSMERQNRFTATPQLEEHC